MKRPTFLDWMREQFCALMGESGERVWSEGEELRKRRRLGDVSIQEGRLVGRFTGEKPYRAELLTPVFTDETWRSFLTQQERSARVTAYLFANLLPWGDEGFRDLLSPAGIIPKDEQASGPGNYSPYTAALLQDLASKLEVDPFVIFQLRGRGRDEVLEALRGIRAQLLTGTDRAPDESETDSEEEPLASWESISPALYDISYSLRADELPALLFKRIESIPLQGKTDNVEHILSELYVHIAKRAQAYGLSFRR